MHLNEIYTAVSGGELIVWLIILINGLAALLFYLTLDLLWNNKRGAGFAALFAYFFLIAATDWILSLTLFRLGFHPEPGPEGAFILSLVISLPLIASLIFRTVVKIRQLR